MKLLNLLLILFMTSILVAQDDESDDLENTEEIVSCELKNKKLEFDDFKYEGTDKAMDVKIWYNQYGSRRFKKWKASKSAELSKDVKKYFWQVIVVDSLGEVKNRSGVPVLKYAYEKLSQVYLHENEIEILEVLLARGLKFRPKSTKLNRYAAMLYTSVQKKQCAINHFEKVVLYTKLKPKTKNFILNMTKRIIGLYEDIGDDKKAIETCDKYLAIDPNDEEIKSKKTSLLGDPEEVLKLYLSDLEKTPDNYDLIAKAGRLAASLEEDDIAVRLLKKHLLKFPEHQNNKDMLTKILYRNEDFSGVIKYGASSNDRNIRKYVIKAYGDKGLFKKAFSLAKKVQRSDRAQGHFLKGQVFEAAASAAKEEYAKKSYEWRLLYRLAYIEYDLVNDSRKSNIHGLIPTKGDIFLKNKRVKPNAGKFSSWITWEKSYNKEVFGPDN